MTELVLSSNARNVLFALMVSAEDVSNQELHNRVGLRLDGADRRLLNENKLVTSERIGPNRSFVHELTDKGWAWCGEELTKEPPARSAPATRVLYQVLGSLDRYLRRADLTMAALFAPEATSTGLPDRVMATYRSLVDTDSKLVSLADLRDELSDVDRSELDDTLRAMALQAQVELIPEVNRKVLTDRERAGALTMGGESREYLAIDES